MATSAPVILVTFAGRRDRMALLAGYVGEAIRRNLIDEWHVWDFSRNDDDGRWLASRFPTVGRTADDPTYCAAGELVPGAPWRSRVRASNDVHIGLAPHPGNEEASAYELVVGGWSNQRTVLRQVRTDELFLNDHEWRADRPPPVADLYTPGVLSQSVFRDLEVSVGASGLALSVDGNTVLSGVEGSAAGAYSVYVKTGYGSDGEWRFPELAATEYRYRTAGGQGWAEFYRFYSVRAEYYADAVFLKCDDDVVYLQLEQLAEFIRFRRREPNYFLVSANVVNNGVCAYYQQQSGAIPRDLMELTLPPDGFGGTLWESGTLASRLHHHFLNDPRLFEEMPQAPIPWRGRLSINFVSWLGADISYLSAVDDDELLLSVVIPGYLGRPNCIFPGFLASHLSFYPQVAQLDHHALLARYRILAKENGLPDEG
ncbi:hypothetical protein ACIBCN_37105 [Nocardia sp. NPDC051052]|uniref:hypothetical protein n=1 Tax=Nocardia sp. NPDC051052 TaxID=3364322 RepID=UPI0037B9E347